MQNNAFIECNIRTSIIGEYFLQKIGSWVLNSWGFVKIVVTSFPDLMFNPQELINLLQNTIKL